MLPENAKECKMHAGLNTREQRREDLIFKVVLEII